MVHFVYLWFDVARKMFYVGSHSGTLEDGYVSSSRWLNGEYRYRPHDFRRRILSTFITKNEAQRAEGRLLSLIRGSEFGTKYYNMKIGRPSGLPPWNKGKKGIHDPEKLRRRSEAMMGNKSNTGKKMPKSADNGRLAAPKLTAIATGRKMVLRDGKRTWAYPCDVDYPKVG